jgi:hypothetical protein
MKFSEGLVGELLYVEALKMHGGLFFFIVVRFCILLRRLISI